MLFLIFLTPVTQTSYKYLIGIASNIQDHPPKLHRHYWIQVYLEWNLHRNHKRFIFENCWNRLSFSCSQNIIMHTHIRSHLIPYFYVNKICWLWIISTNIFSGPVQFKHYVKEAWREGRDIITKTTESGSNLKELCSWPDPVLSRTAQPNWQCCGWPELLPNLGTYPHRSNYLQNYLFLAFFFQLFSIPYPLDFHLSISQTNQHPLTFIL